MKVSVRFPNGGIGEIIIAEDIMVDAKESRGGHTCYEIRRQLEKTEAYQTDIEVAKCVKYLKDLEYAIYDRAGFDAGEFARLKAMASDSVARLEGNAAISSSVDMNSVKSLSSKLHLCEPYSSSFQATPVTSEIKYDISETSDNGNYSDLSSTSSITENEKNRHYQTEEDEMAQILAYLQFYDGREFVYWQTKMADRPQEDVWDKIKPYSNAACKLVFDGVFYDGREFVYWQTSIKQQQVSAESWKQVSRECEKWLVMVPKMESCHYMNI